MDTKKDHLFISYAWEDSAFVDWLALKLTAAGYLVWRDQTKLLGGEPYPTDIDEAIKASTFRLLAILSRHSINKSNPRKERTLALNLGRERGEPDFLIPLNLDGLRPTELDWMTSDLTFIPFFPSWSEGLAKLFKKLDSVHAPKPLDGRALVSAWVAQRDHPAERPERLWSNSFPILEMPMHLVYLRSAGEPLFRFFNSIPFVRENDLSFWAFEVPEDLPQSVEIEKISWFPSSPNDDLARKVVRLLRLYMWNHCLRRGLRRTKEEKRTYCYFSEEEDGKRKLFFTSYSGRKSWVNAVGQRKFRIGPGIVETSRYHLSPDFLPRLFLFPEPAFCLSIHVHLTNEDGLALPPRKAFRRRKKICGAWWNHQWLSRQLGIMQWLSDGSEIFGLTTGPTPINVSAVPYQLASTVGIDIEAKDELYELDEPENLDSAIADDSDDYEGEP